MPRTLRRVKRLLRSPAVIVAEVAAIGALAAVGAVVPQQGAASAGELARFHASWPLAAFLAEALAADRVFRSGWFLAITALATASLAIVVVEQIRRLRVTWRLPATEAQLRAAPFRIDFERPARATAPGAGRRVEVRTKGRAGLAGPALFHGGLLLVVIAGALRALFAVDAAVDLIEGETLPPTAAAWRAQWPGLLAPPFRLAGALTLDAVRPTRYESGALRDVTVRLTMDHPEGRAHAEVAVNGEVRAPGGRVFLGSEFGPAALLEWRDNGQPAAREAVLLGSRGKGTYEAASAGPGGTRLFLRAQVDHEGAPPERLEIRVLRVTQEGRFPLLFAGLLPVGSEVSLPDGRALRLHGLPFWARLRGSRDPALALAYVGFGLALAGAAIMFTIVKVDTCVVVVPSGDRERVFVALRPHRFAPLFEERFARLVRAQGGTV